MDKLFKYLSYTFVVLLLICVGFVISIAPDAPNMAFRNADKSFKDETVEVELRGEVKNEGTYIVNTGMSLYDALYMAGGITESADVSSLDLDGIITSDCSFEIAKSENNSFFAIAEYEFLSDASSQKCNINTASAKQLTKLPGIGETIAGRIVDYRTQNGDFKSIDEILNVKGIGEKTYSEFKDYITVGGE